jgi:glycosyltransferase involved in cell wall biosynthesis
MVLKAVKPYKVSVLIPSYNCARYLPEAIESVLGQDFRDFELLIVDDCSADDSLGIIKHYAALDSRIRVQANPVNLGAVQNWNCCLAQANGDYVKFLCCDDTLVCPNALGKMVEMLDTSPTATLAASARIIIDEHSKLLRVRRFMEKPGLYKGCDVVMRCFEKNGNLIGEPSAVLFRRKSASRGFDVRYRQIVDLEMWYHLLEQGDLAYTPEPLCSFRLHPFQLTAINDRNRAGKNEQDMLLKDYFPKPWLQQRLSRKALFIQIYHQRKRRRRGRGLDEYEQQMLAMLGQKRYAAFWLAYKITRPLLSLRRAAQKHLWPNGTGYAGRPYPFAIF